MKIPFRPLTLIITLPLAAILVSAETRSFADPHYVKYKNDQFNYEIVIPSRWKTDELTLSKKHIMSCFSDSTEIKVRAFVSDEADIDSTIRKRNWNLRKIDPLLNRILETEKISIKKNINGKLLVFEYRSQRTRLLQRTMITRNDKTIYIIDCKAPLNRFYRNEESFNIAFSSFKFLSGSPSVEEPARKTPPADNGDAGLDELDDQPKEPAAKIDKSAQKKQQDKKGKSGEEEFFELE